MAQSNQTPAQLKQFQEETVNQVLSKVNEFQEMGALTLPKDYSPANALKAAWFKLLETKDKNKNRAVDVCSKASIADALMKMVTEGLNVQKNQCSFIVYGNQLTMQREYFGTIALAKRFNPDIKRITANVIYKNDDFQFEINPDTGMRKVIKHEQTLENIDITKIRGAYATIIFTDGTSEMEPMTISQIQKAWEQGSMNGNSGAHKNFTDQMAKKTVINRACKPYINASSDAVLMDGQEKELNVPEEENTETLDIEYDEEKETPKEQPQKAEKNPNPQPEKEEPRKEGKASVPDELKFD